MLLYTDLNDLCNNYYIIKVIGTIAQFNTVDYTTTVFGLIIWFD